MDCIELSTIEDGSVVSAAGFRAAGLHAGFRKNPQRYDVALLEADELCVVAGTFTQNVFCSAPVQVCKARLGNRGYGMARAVVINSGIANAATGPEGLRRARKSARIVAGAVGCAEDDVLVASTGVIGVQLPMEPYKNYAAQLHESASASAQSGHDAARATMTTDTHPKEYAVSYVSSAPGLQGVTFTVGGMAKGSGMIMPNMATMISCITTDAPLSGPVAHQVLLDVVNQTFNKVTVDSDTSTNDTCLLLASGKAAPSAMAEFTQDSQALAEFRSALLAVCTWLARDMARDGEGASKLVTVNVSDAANNADADEVARSIANSPLVKTAIYGHDANWGRIAAAAGKTHAAFQQEDVNIAIMGMPVCQAGLPVKFSEEEALARFEEPEIVIDVDLGSGDAATTVWTCDFTHEYITINGDYRS
ncbi:arginine biosynthesis protein ArgJ [Denitrobacterium detoxificans]|uniref:Arginine biosynthesis bifunctional protein ArgJ n=1 Tax=Denitrobacterium detoxificans TaxID=79604 RepID=A0A172RWW3_9ACTN|nr:bifunctional glutamate N-acetyltransferase/amino-acid acetyltransferase ArgJ [Denitrobacterium detoxificans]ANE22103.1 arginine biosynthesis protein ArgJ [Denitrobacterium detoxificans]SEO88822.1 glutamate N-acetyltransferase [Denitrobacterium detoxificans]